MTGNSRTDLIMNELPMPRPHMPERPYIALYIGSFMTKNFHLTPDSCVLEVAMVFSRPAGTCVV